MRASLEPGVKARFSYPVPVEKTVPHIYRESEEMQAMPEVFATGFMVALMEWTCVKALAPYLDEGEGSVGVHVDVSHDAATPVGMTVTVDAEVTEIEGKRIWFYVCAHDGVDQIGEGYHQRTVVSWDLFKAKVAEKQTRAAE